MLDIHQSCKDRLIRRLTNVINNAQIEQGYKGYDVVIDTCIDLFSINESLPNTRQLKTVLENYIGEDPLLEFCLWTIEDIVRTQENYNEGRPTYPLTEVPFFQNTQEAAEHIISGFISLPKKYVAIFKLNKELSASFERFSPRALRNHDAYFITEDIKLSVPTPELRATFPEVGSKYSLAQNHFDWQD